MVDNFACTLLTGTSRVNRDCIENHGNIVLKPIENLVLSQGHVSSTMLINRQKKMRSSYFEIQDANTTGGNKYQEQ